MRAELLQLLQAAQQHHQAGLLAEAEAGYRRVLEERPDDPAATHFLGLLKYQTQRISEGLELMAKSVARPSPAPDFLFNYGVALDQQDRWIEAIPLYQRTVELRPQYPEALVNLAAALGKLRRFDEGVALCRRALALRPGWDLAQFNLGQCLKGSGLVAHFGGKPTEAAELYRQALGMRPEDDAAAALLTIALAEIERGDAVETGTRAVERFRESAAVRWALGFAVERAGRLDEAMNHYRAALRFAPRHGEKPPRLPDVPPGEEQLTVAVRWCRDAVSLNPANLATLVIAAQVLARDREAGDDAAGAFARVLEKDPSTPDVAWALSNRVLSLHYAMPVSPDALYREHARLGKLYEVFAPMPPRVEVEDSENRRLRIGYVSADLWTHSVAYFLEPILAHHDRSKFEVFCYSNSTQEDETTQRLRAYPLTWRSIAGLLDAEAAALIRADRIDILVDLSGHTSGNRLGVFARKPAPVAATYLGYPNTTGLSRIDYRITDAVTDPVGHADALHSEKLVRMERCAWCYRSPVGMAEPGALPALSNGFVTFGCFNNTLKLAAATPDLWGKLLIAIPSARLLLKGAGFAEAATRSRILGRLESAGVAPGRVEMLSKTASHVEHFAGYQRVDIAMDTTPYNGTTTTCEAMWMGVPVVTLEGEVHASRVGASLLGTVGLQELVARSREEYVEIVRGLAQDLGRLGELRSTLRARMAGSPLLDGASFTLELERRLHKMWHDHRASASA